MDTIAVLGEITTTLVLVRAFPALKARLAATTGGLNVRGVG